MLKNLWRKYGINPFDTLLKKEKEKGSKRFLICWNRGLGDIPLGLWGLLFRIRTYIPDAEVTFATRSDLADGFLLLDTVSTLVDPEWKRGVPFDLDRTLTKAGLNRSDFDVILEKPDPTRHLMRQIGTVIPQLNWNEKWDGLWRGFPLDEKKRYVGVHVQTETQYAYEKNWPIHYWQKCFQQAAAIQEVEFLLFGFSATPEFDQPGVVDLRGKTSLFEMLSIIKNRCRYLIVPDSGVLSIVYYLNVSFPIDVVSLWADPKQGVLRQNVPSPNPLFHHHPLIAQDKDLRTVSVETALETLFSLEKK